VMIFKMIKMTPQQMFLTLNFTYLFTADASFVSGLLTSSAVVKTENSSNDVTKNWTSSSNASAATTEDKGMYVFIENIY